MNDGSTKTTQAAEVDPETILKHMAVLKDAGNETSGGEITDQQRAIKEALRAAKIDPDKEPTENPVLATIGNETFATLGNFSMITGKAKSKKTFLITLIVSAFLHGFLHGIKVNKFPGKKRITWFDTEQSRYHIFKAFKRALTLANISRLYNIEVYDLRPYSPQERLEMIEYVLRDENPKRDIAFVVIDGIRDLVTDINDPTQATNTVTWLMKLTADIGLHICTVLHQNKGDNNARGHLGTEIINKAESVLSVQKDTSNGDISIVKAEQCRDKEFYPFAFSINDAGLPYLLEAYKPAEQGTGGRKKIMPQTIPAEKHRELMTEIFSIQSEYRYRDLLDKVKLKYHEYGVEFGDTKAREFISHGQNLEIIKHNNKQGPKARYLLSTAGEGDILAKK